MYIKVIHIISFLDVEKEKNYMDSQRPGLRISTFFRQLAFEILYVLEFVVLLGFGFSSEVKEFKEYNDQGELTFTILLVSLWLISLVLKILYYIKLHMWSNVIVAGKVPIQKDLKNVQEFFQYVFMSRNTWICGSLKNIQTTLIILPKNIIESISKLSQDLIYEFKSVLGKCNLCNMLKFLSMLLFSLVCIIFLLVLLVLSIPILTVLFIWNLTAKNGFIIVTADGKINILELVKLDLISF